MARAFANPSPHGEPHAPARPGRLLAVCAVDRPGGAEIGLLRLLAALSTRGWEVTVTTPGRGRLRDAAQAAGHAWRALGVGGLRRGAGAGAMLSWPLVRHLSRRADVVYLNGGVCGRLLPAIGHGGARRVLHVHDIVDRVPSFWRSADVVLADSQAVADRLIGLHAHVVGCPVDLDPPAAPPPWTTAAAGATGPVIGFVGRIEPRKGVADLVAAAPAIRRGAPGARVVLIGDDPYGSAPEYTAAVTGSGEVEHVAWVDNAAGVMRHLDVLVLPSRQEPFGTVLAEAMAVGTPVVATRVGGLAEVVADGVTGRLVGARQPADLAVAVLEVLAARDTMSAAARDHARRFDAGAYAARVERLIAPGSAATV
jgi:glycosyltransferase involved in cell wall biosynthesis